MNRRGLTLIEMTFAICITATIGAAIASMMVAVTNGITSRDDGRRTAIQLATTQVRLAAYIAPARCVLSKGTDSIIIWIDDNRESGTVHASEIRWLAFDESMNSFVVKFVDFPEEWSQSMIDNADIECNQLTNYENLLIALESDELITELVLVDSMHECSIWIDEIDPLEAIRVSFRFAFITSFGPSTDGLINESIRQHLPPSEQS